jgi:hypothetical protein
MLKFVIQIKNKLLPNMSCFYRVVLIAPYEDKKIIIVWQLF